MHAQRDAGFSGRRRIGDDQVRDEQTPGEQATSQLLHLRSATVPVPVLAAAAVLIAPQLEDSDPATREAVGAVHAHLLAATAAADLEDRQGSCTCS
ncbi:hypothetical protein [Kitasatospora sp. P5_F3]